MIMVKSQVPISEQLKVFAKYKSLLFDENLEAKSYTCEIFDAVHKDIPQMTKKAIQLSVKRNKNEILQLDETDLQISVNSVAEDKSFNRSFADSVELNAEKCKSVKSININYGTESESDASDTRTLYFSSDITDKNIFTIQTYQSGGKTRKRVGRDWSSKLRSALWELYKLPCAFALRRADVVANTISINGSCKDKNVK